MRIVLLEPLGIPEETLRNFASRLEAEGHQFVAYNERVEDPETLISRSSEADIVILTNLPFPGEVIKACPNLKMISVAFTGVDHIDIEACKERGITVCNAAGYSTPSVAELTFGLIIALLRKVVQCDEVTRNEKTKAGLIGNELFGKTLGIVGTGAIGINVAKIGKAFGCKLLAFSRTEKAEGKELGIKYVDLETLLKESDIVTLHTPLTEETKLLINKERINIMKPNSILINTARGPVVDSEALYEALKEGKIAGAAADVFEMEPPIPKDHPLLKAPNMVVTPHVAFATQEAFHRRAEIVFGNIEAWLKGKPENLII